MISRRKHIPHEKMFNITNHQGNANQLNRMAIIKKATSNKYWQGCREKGESFVDYWWGCKLVQPITSSSKN